MKRRTFTLAAVAVLAFVVALDARPAEAGDHLRVVLDLSLSMGLRPGQGNDPDRLAKLATLLLYDLADPNLTQPENSFVVYPFHGTVHWKSPSDPAPTLVGSPIDPRAAGATAADHRKALQQHLGKLAYNAKFTYFYPGLRRSLEDLEKTPGGVLDRRVIVLVTDGLPESVTKDAELALIQSTLGPRLQKAGVQVYVMAFGKVAHANSAYFSELVKTPSGASLGEVLVDPTGAAMLEHMIQVFSWSFGYTHERTGARPATSGLDLAGGVGREPERALVVAFSSGTQAPRLDLRPPQGGDPNLLLPPHLPEARKRDGFQGTGVGARAAYTLQRVAWPKEGLYKPEPVEKPAQLAVLRPTILELKVFHEPTRKRGGGVARVMARKELPLTVEVGLPGAAKGALPPDVQVHFQVHLGAAEPGAPGYRESSRASSSPGSRTSATGSGLRYEIRPLFEKDPLEGEAFYPAFVEVWALRGHARVGELRGKGAFRVEVYPFLRIVPSPIEAGAKRQGTFSRGVALGRGARGCAEFAFTLQAGPGGKLPTLAGRDDYPIRAVLPGSLSFSGPLAGAAFSLGGDPLRPEGLPGPAPGAWYTSQNLDGKELLGSHRACVHIGRPSRGDPALRVQVRFTLDEPPYDQFDVIEPFTLKVHVAPPGFFDRFGAILLLILALLGLLALLWYLRRRPTLPGDLCASVGPMGIDGIAARLVPVSLGEPGLAARLLGLRERRSLELDDGTRLGQVIPVDAELFRFRPGPEVSVRPVIPEKPDSRFSPHEDLLVLRIRTLYRADIASRAWHFQVEYR